MYSPRRFGPFLRGFSLALTFLLVGSCGGDGGGTGPVVNGSIDASISTTGSDLPTTFSFTASSSDGSVSASGTIPANGSRAFTGVPPGVSVQVQIGDIPANCTLAGQNPRSATSVSGQTTTISFQLSCVALVGSVRVLTATAGTELDPDGYSISVGGQSAVLDPNDEETFTDVPVGSIQVELSGLDGSCSLDGENPRTLQVAFGQTVETAFQVTCPVALTVTTQTTGDDLDADGYSLSLDLGAPGAIGINATQEFALAAGDHTLELTGVAQNCSVGGDNPRTVTLPLSIAVQSTFEVTCLALQGSIEVQTTTTGWDIPVAFAFKIGAESQGTLGPNALLDIPGLPVESHSVELTDVPAHCSVQGENPQTVDVLANGTVEADFVIACGGIAFESERDGDRGIFIQDSDGVAPATRLIPGMWFYQDPTWSPDRTKIAYSCAQGAFLRICVISADGTGAASILTSGNFDDSDPEWSPDGTKIAYRSEQGGDKEIWVMDADGSNKVQLTNNAFSDYEPSWSPDGRSITFFSSRDGDYEIYVMKSDGSSGENPTKLTNNLIDDEDPVFSPDGTQIVFVSERDGDEEIFVMNADGTMPTQLTFNTADDDDPNWSPDGMMIAFTSDRDGNDEIYVMNADGTVQRNLSNNPAKEDEAGWRD